MHCLCGVKRLFQRQSLKTSRKSSEGWLDPRNPVCTDIYQQNAMSFNNTCSPHWKWDLDLIKISLWKYAIWKSIKDVCLTSPVIRWCWNFQASHVWSPQYANTYCMNVRLPIPQGVLAWCLIKFLLFVPTFLALTVILFKRNELLLSE